MIFHCTKALASKLPEVSPTPLTDANPLVSWHVHLHVIDRRQCIMFCHDTTRSVLGTMNRSRFEFDFFLDDYANILEVDPLIAAKWFNHRPLSVRGKYLWADEQMLALVSSL